MKRFALDRLVEWKNNPNKKPLILNGARQVGKTWLMKELGKKYYKDYLYINFDKNPDLEDVFKQNLDPKRIIKRLSIINEKEVTDDTLIIFDEIQEVPKALSSLKYFEEETNYNIICAGSLLGVALHKGISYPVGKVENINIYPMNFYEFLIGTDKKNLYDALVLKDWELIKILKERFIDALKEYFIVGGMPGVINVFKEKNSFLEVQKVQEEILGNYEKDFSKHTSVIESEKVRQVWHSIPSQLGKENKKFIYGHIREGARAKEYENAINWLIDCGLVYKIQRINVPKIPLNAYKDERIFKLYLCDIGLLAKLSGLEYKDLLNNNNLFIEFKGSLTEEFVCMELIEKLNLAYYTNDRNTCEIDFVTKIGQGIVPIEVKANVNLQAKSLKTYIDKFKPDFAIRTSMADYKENDNLYDIPLYAISEITNII